MLAGTVPRLHCKVGLEMLAGNTGLEGGQSRLPGCILYYTKGEPMALMREEQIIIRNLADEYGIPQDFALGITDKESAGKALWNVDGNMLPSIRIEGHYFYKYLTGQKLTTAIAQGLASKKAGAVKNPASFAGRYAMLNRMIMIDREAAYRSISIGIGQVMGANFAALGYKYATYMFNDACKGLIPQVRQMLGFIRADPRLVKAANSYDYKTFARIYNGPAYKKNRYDTELEKFVSRWPKRAGNTSVVGISTNNETDFSRIQALGFHDVRGFQAARGIKVDGIIGPITIEHINLLEQERKPNTATNVAIVGSGTAVGAAGAVAVAGPDIDTEKYMPLLNTITSMASHGSNVLIGIAVVAVGVFAGVMLYKRFFR